MARPVPTLKTPRFVLLASIAVTVAALYFAQDVLIPLALATLLTFLLSPLVQRLEHWRLHRVPSVIVVVVLAFGVVGVLGWVVVDQVMSLARDLPAYKDNIKAKLYWLPHPGEQGVLGQIKQTVKELNQEIAHPPPKATTQSTQPATPAPRVTPPPVAGAAAATPVPVTIVPTERTPWDVLKENAGKIAGPLGTAGIVA